MSEIFTEDARAVSDDNDGDIAFPIVEDGPHLTLVIAIEEETFGETKVLTELLARLQSMSEKEIDANMRGQA